MIPEGQIQCYLQAVCRLGSYWSLKLKLELLGAIGKRYGKTGVLERCIGMYSAAPGIESLKNVVIQMNQNVFETGAGKP